MQVVEVNQPDRATRRKRGESDAVDADAARPALKTGRPSGGSESCGIPSHVPPNVRLGR
ncbi:hypothetical protein ACLVWQ_13330 [Streptomyces sp. CWNU-52B]|uniref:hypothetical protein n=1 Tax=unclassified Streptomyces TaxID=2593676 RepID=UPI0039C3CDE6